MINGLTNDIYTTEYPIREGCMSHARLEPIIELLEFTSASSTLGDLLDVARRRLGPDSVLEFDSEIVTTMVCPECEHESPVFKRMARLYETEFTCPECGSRRDMNLTHRIDGSESYLDRTLAGIDVPALGIIRARNGKERIYLELTGDRETFFQFQ